MSAKIRNIGLSSAALIAFAVAAWYFFVRIPPVTVEYLQGEWVQDPDFLQHAGEDLDAQKREVDLWENYEFSFKDTHLQGWRMVFDDGAKNMSGWAEGRGTVFESDYTLTPAGKVVIARFTDHKKSPVEAALAREGTKIAVSIGDRRFRLMKAPATNLRARNILIQK